MYILGGPASTKLAKKIATTMHQPMLHTEYKRFPDGEFYTRLLDQVENQDVIIIQTTYPDTRLVELFILQDAVKRAKANKIIVVIPYFGYGRQDKQFQLGEPISAKTFAEHISKNADMVITVDPHKEHLLDFFTVPAYSCSALPELAQYLKEKKVDFILAPDKGAQQRAEETAHIIGCDSDYMEKTRIDGHTVTIKPKHLNAQQKNVAIIDDIISTGGTMAKSIQELKIQGAKQIQVACTHGLLVDNAQNKLISAGCDEIITTDTIENEFNTVSAAPGIIDVIKKKL